MLGVVLGLEGVGEAHKLRAYARRLVDGYLFFYGEVHHQVEKGIGRTTFGCVVFVQMALRLGEQIVVFGMFLDELRG